MHSRPPHAAPRCTWGCWYICSTNALRIIQRSTLVVALPSWAAAVFGCAQCDRSSSAMPWMGIAAKPGLDTEGLGAGQRPSVAFRHHNLHVAARLAERGSRPATSKASPATSKGSSAAPPQLDFQRPSWSQAAAPGAAAAGGLEMNPRCSRVIALVDMDCFYVEVCLRNPIPTRPAGLAAQIPPPPQMVQK